MWNRRFRLFIQTKGGNILGRFDCRQVFGGLAEWYQAVEADYQSAAGWQPAQPTTVA